MNEKRQQDQEAIDRETANQARLTAEERVNQARIAAQREHAARRAPSGWEWK